MGLLTWLLTCIAAGGLLCAWAVLRLQVRFPWIVVPLGLVGSVAVLAAASYGDYEMRHWATRLSDVPDVQWLWVEWAVGPREEAAKLMVFLALFGRFSPRRLDGAQQLLGMVVIGVGFAALEALEQLPAGLDATACAAVTALRMAQGAPFHAWTGLCDALIWKRAVDDRRWLAVLPLPAVLHSYYDFSFGLHGTQIGEGARSVELVVLGIAAILLVARRGPPRKTSRARRLLLAASLGAIPAAVGANELLNATYGVGAGSFSPRLAAAVIAAPWATLALDVLLSARGQTQAYGRDVRRRFR